MDMRHSGTFLLAGEVRELTGYATRRLQCQWLAERSWPFEVDGYGRPVVLRSVLECKLGTPNNDGFTLDEAKIA